MLIYKIFRAPEWALLQSDGETDGAPVDVADGYVHFSTAAQAAETAAKHFASEDDLWLLALDADTLAPDLKWEPSRGGALFPHLYRRLRRSDVLWARPLPLENGAHVFPEDMA
ncbi:hypothetical protein GCM10011534_02790 [Pseudooceanicola nanhaiensis]|jgi:uncharacterized protein (DUF952 family)|uniref:DUF952 domain-containing protein n=1 Tax=Pseudooceanicola nanhaiensis TaxID=375761 RepID=A0A917WAI4_9RHOB|nr:DUF952 domain-containing protein [Pseudooceanicola nanhaiensis]GGL84328.1 hypothetical protein GCM10011534_02790 [Pseudooceanicola nanhaiensis]